MTTTENTRMVLDELTPKVTMHRNGGEKSLWRDIREPNLPRVTWRRPDELPSLTELYCTRRASLSLSGSARPYGSEVDDGRHRYLAAIHMAGYKTASVTERARAGDQVAPVTTTARRQCKWCGDNQSQHVPSAAMLFLRSAYHKHCIQHFL